MIHRNKQFISLSQYQKERRAFRQEFPEEPKFISVDELVEHINTDCKYRLFVYYSDEVSS